MNRLVLATLLCGLGGSVAPAQWQRQAVKSDADFRGLCVISSNVAWVGGTKGTFCRTTDGGKTWAVGTVPGADKLDFREGEPYYIGAFLLGAYQEILGDLHNLFGDTNAVHVHLEPDGTPNVDVVIKGDTVTDVLHYCSTARRS